MEEIKEAIIKARESCLQKVANNFGTEVKNLVCITRNGVEEDIYFCNRLMGRLTMYWHESGPETLKNDLTVYYIYEPI